MVHDNVIILSLAVQRHLRLDLRKKNFTGHARRDHDGTFPQFFSPNFFIFLASRSRASACACVVGCWRDSLAALILLLWTGCRRAVFLSALEANGDFQSCELSDPGTTARRRRCRRWLKLVCRIWRSQTACSCRRRMRLLCRPASWRWSGCAPLRVRRPGARRLTAVPFQRVRSQGAPRRGGVLHRVERHPAKGAWRSPPPRRVR